MSLQSGAGDHTGSANSESIVQIITNFVNQPMINQRRFKTVIELLTAIRQMHQTQLCFKRQAGYVSNAAHRPALQRLSLHFSGNPTRMSQKENAGRLKRK